MPVAGMLMMAKIQLVKSLFFLEPPFLYSSVSRHIGYIIGFFQFPVFEIAFFLASL